MRPITAMLPGLLLLLGGCESLQTTDSLLGVITPYRIDIVQGNVVTKEQIAAVKTGMSRSQVRDLLGTPLLADPFHAERWDYLFSIRRPGLACFFCNATTLRKKSRPRSVGSPPCQENTTSSPVTLSM